LKTLTLNDLEGFFLLESSVDAEPGQILQLYKQQEFRREIPTSIERRFGVASHPALE